MGRGIYFCETTAVMAMDINHGEHLAHRCLYERCTTADAGTLGNRYTAGRSATVYRERTTHAARDLHTNNRAIHHRDSHGHAEFDYHLHADAYQHTAPDGACR